MIVTLTPNPSIDRTLSVARLRHGQVHRATESRVEPGGKGVNVTRALGAHGTPSVAVLPAGRAEGQLLRELLDACGTSYVAVPVEGRTRTNTAVVEPDGTTTKVNEPGPVLGPGESDALLQAVVDRLGPGVDWVVGSGSLPPGMPTGEYAGLVRHGQAAGARVAVDASGPALAAAVAAAPDLVKPNLEELEQLAGGPLPTLADVREAAARLVRTGVGTVVVSLGGHGALLVTPDVVAFAVAGADQVVSTVAAGDCLLAGYLHAVGHGADQPAALATAVTWGTAATTLPGSQVPTPEDCARVDVRVETDPDGRLPVRRPSLAVSEEHRCR